jgi:hypothetical protein
MDCFPNLPVEEDERMHDAAVCKAFIKAARLHAGNRQQ